MRLTKVRVENFKSIEESGDFSVDQVTCLVGKNEAGKSALLQALYKLNPIEKSENQFNLLEEYPRRHLTDYQDWVDETDGREEANVLMTTWALDPEDVTTIEATLGEGVLQEPQFTIAKGYDNVLRWLIPLDEQAAIKHFLDAAKLTKTERTSLSKVRKVADVIAKLAAIETPSERQRTLLTRLQAVMPEKRTSLSAAAIKMLINRLPTFVYFPDYDKMPGRVSIEELKNNQAHNQLTRPQQIFLALLNLARTNINEIAGAKHFEEFIARLEAVENRLSQDIFRYWQQNKHLKVKFRFDPARPQDPPPFNTGNIFHTRIENTRHGVSVNFDDRSTGFVWFFSFLVWFSQAKKTYGEQLILLLDEPGLSLHGKAQGDLLRYINEQLRPHYQVIYTTHSPFMVDPDNLMGVRTVEDVVTKDDEVLGTKVGEDVLSTDPDTTFPLQAALGYDLTQPLFIGKHSLLVEGPSDLLYLKWASRELQTRDCEFLDQRWTITPCGGIEKIGSFATLFGGNNLHIAVLTDFHSGDKKKIENLRKSELLKAGHVFTADMFVQQNEADIEDILGRPFYVALVNQTYGLKKSQQLKTQKPKEAPERVVSEVEAHFRTLPPDVEEFDHYAPAQYLIEHSGELRSTLPNIDETLERFENLFKSLNRLLS